MELLALRDTIIKSQQQQPTSNVDYASAYSAVATKYYGVAVCLMFVCDYIETFDQEVNYMWKHNGNRWNLARILFFLCRYITLGQLPLLLALFAPGLSSQVCYNMHIALLVMTWVVEAFPIAILLLCMYALFESKRSLAPYFIGSYTVLTATLLSTSAVYISNMTLPPPEMRGRGCFTLNTDVGDRFMLANRLIRLIAHLVMVVLASWRGWQRYRSLRSPLMKAIYEGGMLYYGGIFLMAAADVIARYYAPGDPARIKIMTYIGRMGAPILANRLLLRMYKEVRNRQESGVVRSMSGLRFEPSKAKSTYGAGAAESGASVKFTSTVKTQSDGAHESSYRYSTSGSVDTKVSRTDNSYIHMQ